MMNLYFRFVGYVCTMCNDLSMYVKRLSKRDSAFVHRPIGQSQRKILERFLMELYCHNTESDSFRMCPSHELVRYKYTIWCGG